MLRVPQYLSNTGIVLTHRTLLVANMTAELRMGNEIKTRFTGISEELS